MYLTLIGYFLKRTSVPDGWGFSKLVVEICSVSHCSNPPPEDWIQRWLHNSWGFFNTREDAQTMVVDPSEDHHLLAFRLLPVRFVDGHREPLDIPELSVEPLPAEFVSLGFDVVSKCTPDSLGFDCSPLSCNGMATEVPVNRFCLLDTLGEAESFADRCSVEEPEPGPYYVLEILRARD